jgi:hypothetical protein
LRFEASQGKYFLIPNTKKELTEWLKCLPTMHEAPSSKACAAKKTKKKKKKLK